MAGICDTLIRIKNGYLARKGMIKVLKSKYNLAVLSALKEHGYINSFKEDDSFFVSVFLQYGKWDARDVAAIRDIYLYSKSGGRVYVKTSDIDRFYKHSRFDTLFLSTSKGILTGAEAKIAGVGGELICGVF